MKYSKSILTSMTMTDLFNSTQDIRIVCSFYKMTNALYSDCFCFNITKVVTQILINLIALPTKTVSAHKLI